LGLSGLVLKALDNIAICIRMKKTKKEE